MEIEFHSCRLFLVAAHTIDQLSAISEPKHARNNAPCVFSWRGRRIMTEPIITCPNCRTDIKLTESLAAPLIETTRREFGGDGWDVWRSAGDCWEDVAGNRRTGIPGYRGSSGAMKA